MPNFRGIKRFAHDSNIVYVFFDGPRRLFDLKFRLYYYSLKLSCRFKWYLRPVEYKYKILTKAEKQIQFVRLHYVA